MLLHRRPCILANGRVQVEEGAEDGRQGGEEAAEAQEERSRRAAFATHRLVVMEKVLEKGTGHTQAARRQRASVRPGSRSREGIGCQ